MWPMDCSFCAEEVCMNFCGGLLHRRRRIGLEPLKLVIFHLMQHNFADMRCVAFCIYIHCLKNTQTGDKKVNLYEN